MFASELLECRQFMWMGNIIKVSQKTIIKIVIENIFLKFMFSIQNNYVTTTMIYHFCLKEWKLKKMKILYPTCMIKKEYDIHIKFFKKH